MLGVNGSANSTTNRAKVTDLPHSKQGSIILTTRDRQIGEKLIGRKSCMSVQERFRMEATSLVRVHLEDQKFLNSAELDEFFDLLSYLPLAITHAIAYINENSILLDKYLLLLRGAEADVQDLLEEDSGDIRRAEENTSSVFKTWRLSFDLIPRKNQRAGRVLSLIALPDGRRPQKNFCATRLITP